MEKQAVHTKDKPRIVILGLGNLLYSDEGFGTQLVERLQKEYEFPENVSAVDGGVLGLRLVNVIAEADRLIVVDAIKSDVAPGSVCRLEGASITDRIRSKNSMHEVDFLETLSVCRLMGRIPHTVLICVEPADMQTLRIGLTPAVEAALEPVTSMVAGEIKRAGSTMTKRSII